MVLDNVAHHMAQDEGSLIGISVSVAALFLLAALSMVGAMCCALVFFGSALSSGPHWFMFGGWAILTCGFSRLGLLTFRAATALYQERNWALWIARVWGVSMIGLAAMTIYDLHHPHEPAADEYYGLLFAPPCMLLGVCWIIYLALPHVRARFRRHLE